MRIRWLGWAGVEIEEQGEWIVIDPLQDARAVFDWVGEPAATLPLPEMVSPRPGAVAGFVTHLHRDHADAAALVGALAAGATLYEPDPRPIPAVQLATAQADRELTEAGLRRRPRAQWASTTVGPFTVTAVPAVDGTGDPQVSWLVAAGDKRVLHLGDTMFHGWWWPIVESLGAPDVVLAPINGARVSFPHRRPASPVNAVMDPAQAALATELLQAEHLVPIHYDGYALPGVYDPVPDALGQLTSLSPRVTALKLGTSLEV